MARRAHRRRRRCEEGQTELPSRTELQPWRVVRLGSNGDLNLNTSLDVDDDLLDGLGGGEEARAGSAMVLARRSNRIKG